MKQYDVYLADLPLREGSHVQGGKRPVVVMSVDSDASEVVTVIPLTKQLEKRHKPAHALIIGERLSGESLALADHMLTVDKPVLLHQIGRISNPCDQRTLNLACLAHLGLASISINT